MSKSLKEQYELSPLFGANAPFVEYFYEQFLADPNSVEPSLKTWFESITNGADGEIPRGPIQEQFRARARAGRRLVTATVSEEAVEQKQAAVLRLIEAYRIHGDQLARLDPLGLSHVPAPEDLAPEYFGLTDADRSTQFVTAQLAGTDRLSLAAMLDLLERIYCGTVAAELAHISDTAERTWLQQRFETGAVRDLLSPDQKRTLLRQLTGAEGIERYLHTRYVGQKRFSLEGSESLIPLLDDLILRGGTEGIEEIIIGMAHRGRINVLVNVLGKPPAELFSEFEGLYDLKEIRGSGDVKYHLGFSADINTPGGNVHVALAFNPSHLEIVNPVVEGSVRARQQRRNDMARKQVLPVLIHGDASFAGQGVVMETLQLSQARGYTTGGTVHVIVNNQIGFTTSEPTDARSTPYCSDVAKILEAPVFHVNADNPEAVVFVTRLALDYRLRFGKDVFVDLVCYRRHGHSEADEPAATQPLMYGSIKKHPTTREIYARSLTDANIVTEQDVRGMVDEYRAGLDAGIVVHHDSVRTLTGNAYSVDWAAYRSDDWRQQVRTQIPLKRLRKLAALSNHRPDGFDVHSRVGRILADREKMAAGEVPLDWGFAEILAYASLVEDGYAIRLSGQDSARGTFFHRHAVLHNQNDASTYIPLAHLFGDQPEVTIIDSLLSEEAVLGFEYGYATAEPNSLIIWEAQFGDFCNGAQVVIDQFISSGEAKWGRLCGLTLFLPHGYEGQGPEHSSARLERFLQLSAEHNIQVCVPSTPAQMFHMLRRQMLRSHRKPLVVMTPKSLLRHRQSTSSLSDITDGQFEPVILEIDDIKPSKVSRIVFCSGKVYYDLLQARRAGNRDDIAIVRIEQLYPFPDEEYTSVIRKHDSAREIVWCQEEPQNQGAWYQIRHRLVEPLQPRHELHYAGREGAAAPASGYYRLHVEQQQELVASALGSANAMVPADKETGTTTVRQKR